MTLKIEYSLFLATQISVATDEIYMLLQAIEVIRSWFVQAHLSVAITHHYVLQLYNGYYYVLPTYKQVLQ
jgi:uncharacterized membrane protein